MGSIIEKYDVKLVERGCAPGTSQFNASITFSNDISEVFPYLNARFKNIWYDHENKVLIWKEDDQIYALRPHEIRAAVAFDLDDAREVAREVVACVNEVWCERERITPRYDDRRPPPMLEILKRLPQTNCRQCGYPTCMAFAVLLSRGNANIEDCPPLSRSEYAPQREQITGLFTPNP
jgi:ArsR family metal-binding transcriptional regulator